MDLALNGTSSWSSGTKGIKKHEAEAQWHHEILDGANGKSGCTRTTLSFEKQSQEKAVTTSKLWVRLDLEIL